MTVSVAEYFGQRTDVANPVILPATTKPSDCPFMLRPCSKIQQNNKPVCSVRNAKGDLWLVCRNRLCATNDSSNLSKYQKSILISIAKTVFGPTITDKDVYVSNEKPMKVTSKTSYHADYVMVINPAIVTMGSPHKAVLEMQGGGETSNTGHLTALVAKWEQTQPYSNSTLSMPASKAGLLITNAWRRQQEQFLVKGSIATKTGGAMILCVGSLLYDYLKTKVPATQMQNLQNYNWDLAIVGIEEDKTATPSPGPIPLQVAQHKVMFVSYLTFIQALINQGAPSASLFKGNFNILSGGSLNIP